ncbi:MAG: hypothetical protein ACRDXC_10155, partial [Acidimicrobiales bacterium]
AHGSPVPLLLARVLPGTTDALTVVGALCAGGLVHGCWERLVRAQVPAWLTALLLLGLGGAPVLWFSAIEDVAGFMGLACFAVAVGGALDFMFSRRTSGGYAAGVSLALAVLCDPAALVYVASLLAAAPFVVWQRFRQEPCSVRSTVAVLAFPTAALLAAWVFLEWRFTGAVWHPIPLAPGALQLPHGAVSALSRSAARVGWELVCCPVFALSALVVLRRRSPSVLAFLAIPVGLVAAPLLGVHASPAQELVLLDLVGLLAVPTRPRRLVAALYAATVPAGILLPLAVFGTSGLQGFLHGVGL